MFVISGVTGNTGSVAAQSLIDQGHPVRVIVRSEEKGTPWKAKGAEVSVAEIMDIDAMTKALEGASGAYFLLPPDLTNEDFLGDSLKRAEAIVEAAKAARLPHAVILSSVGAQHGDKVGPISTIGQMERLFVATNIPLSAVRPAYFLENINDLMPAVLQDGVYPSMILPLDHKIDMVATKDIGLTVADALINPPAVPHRVIELKGAKQYSAKDIAAALSKSLGRQITPVPVPQEAWVDTFKQSGLSQQSAETMAEMHENINNGRIEFLDPNARKAGVDLASFIEKLVA
ncbi:NAD(P)H azoreductase [Roseovarius albus]|uniref:NAD(P)H azoreductase n=1 Tax=Roseovarius albus TaxID=1247867 RepID=A0A1X6YTW2_9RHOB|nr:NmrA family NAD(P)-binding protein [Roseovarius albus]SLN30801.1 NAD(P)H azoreductase [Roseovarius albus]